MRKSMLSLINLAFPESHIFSEPDLTNYFLIRAEFSGDLQSLSWSAMALGGICGSLLGGYTLSTLRIDTIFLLFTLLPVVQLLSCASTEEIPSKMLMLDQKGHGDFQNESDSSITKFSADKSNIRSTRKRKNKKGKKKKRSMKSWITAQPHSSIAVKWNESLKLAMFSLFRALTQPAIYR